MQLHKRGKIREGSCIHCSHSYPDLLFVSVIKIGLYIFTCRLGCVVPHATFEIRCRLLESGVFLFPTYLVQQRK